MTTSAHGMWSSRLMFILAAAGSAVGLGNIWRFPYVAGENGGGTFVLVYLACIFLIGIPIMVSEALLGRAGRQSPIGSMQELTRRSGTSGFWQIIGYLGVLAGFVILSFYVVIAGWVLSYLLKMGLGEFVGVEPATAKATFEQFTGNAWAVVLWFTAFMVMTMWIAARGVGKGLELAVKYLMPALFVLLLALVGWSALTSGHFAEGLAFLFSWKQHEFSGNAVLLAMGQAFFTLSLGMGAIMAYGAYLPTNTSIPSTVTTIALLDTGVALLAGIAIFPLVFANGLEPSSGPGLMFVTLPIAFGQMTGGQLFGTAFFLLVSFAAITSAISLSEPVLAWLVEKLKVSRPVGAGIIGLVTWLLGLGSAFSFNIWSDFQLLPGKTFFDTMDFVANNILLPVGGVLIAFFTGWLLNRSLLWEQLGERTAFTTILLLLVKYVAPLGVGLVFIMSFVG